MSQVVYHSRVPLHSFYDRDLPKIPKASLNSQFPFSSCTSPFLFDTHKSIKHGLASAVHDFRHIHNARQERTLSAELQDMDISEYSSKNQICEESTTNPKISDLKSSLKPSLQAPTDISLTIAHKKLTSLIANVFSASDPEFPEIQNYVINSVIQDFATSDAALICSKILSKSYRPTLLDEIDELVKDKYGEIKLNAFVDACATVFLQSSEPMQYDNPNLYCAYAQIWRFDHHEFKYYGREFFLDSYFSHNSGDRTKVDTYYQNAFMMNIAKFMLFFNKSMRSQEHSPIPREIPDVSPLDDAMSVRYFSDSDLSTLRSTTPESFDTASPVSSEYSGKSIRFDDIIDVIEINKLEPAYYVHCDLNNIHLESPQLKDLQ